MTAGAAGGRGQHSEPERGEAVFLRSEGKAGRSFVSGCACVCLCVLAGMVGPLSRTVGGTGWEVLSCGKNCALEREEIERWKKGREFSLWEMLSVCFPVRWLCVCVVVLGGFLWEKEKFFERCNR